MATTSNPAEPHLDTTEQILPPEQAPMDDAAGGPSVDPNDDRFEEDAVTQVQGGE